MDNPTFLLFRIDYKDHNDGVVYTHQFTTAPFDLIFQNSTWVATGNLLSIGESKSDSQIITDGVAVSLSGIDRTIQPIIDRNGFRNAPVTIYRGIVSDGSNVVTDAKVYHYGYAGTPVTEFDEESGTITVGFETVSAFGDLSKSSLLMTTSKAHHQVFFPNDLFFEYTADIPTGESYPWKTRT